MEEQRVREGPERRQDRHPRDLNGGLDLAPLDRREPLGGAGTGAGGPASWSSSSSPSTSCPCSSLRSILKGDRGQDRKVGLFGPGDQPAASPRAIPALPAGASLGAAARRAPGSFRGYGRRREK